MDIRFAKVLALCTFAVLWASARASGQGLSEMPSARKDCDCAPSQKFLPFFTPPRPSFGTGDPSPIRTFDSFNNDLGAALVYSGKLDRNRRSVPFITALQLRVLAELWERKEKNPDQPTLIPAWLWPYFVPEVQTFALAFLDPESFGEDYPFQSFVATLDGNSDVRQAGYQWIRANYKPLRVGPYYGAESAPDRVELRRSPSSNRELNAPRDMTCDTHFDALRNWSPSKQDATLASSAANMNRLYLVCAAISAGCTTTIAGTDACYLYNSHCHEQEWTEMFPYTWCD